MIEIRNLICEYPDGAGRIRALDLPYARLTNAPWALIGPSGSGKSTLFHAVSGLLTPTTKGSVPLDRDFGVSADYVDKPMAKAKAMLAAEIIQAVRKYEPRVTITGISFTESMDGKLEPRIEVRLNGIKESS